ncbi:MAG: beta-lactamase family protein [Chloroflexi bacterium]|nr:beta-lactamase family protein [Chloroflexota bacterium]
MPFDSRLQRAMRLLEAEVQADRVCAANRVSAATAIYCAGTLEHLQAMGAPGWPERDEPLAEDAIFLIASLTKPVVCAGVMLLVQEGLLSLDEPVADLLPGFGAHGKEAITVRHLMTHTSGLPDQLEDNVALRTRHAPLADFSRAVYGLEPLFPAGTRVRYQSMGILMLQEIAERLTGQRLRDWLRERLFIPLGMRDTTLGLPADGMARTVYAHASGDPLYGNEQTDWGWNSAYWRDLGAPWGGLHATARDLGVFLSHILGEAAGPLSAAARRAMVRDQTAALPDLPSHERLADRWGLGFRLGARAYGDLVSPQTFGHTGATGTLFWADPESRVACVLLTNRPDASRTLFSRYSNAVAAALGG